MTVAKGPAQEIIVLPGNIQAWHDATIYARTNGYITRWYYDIGSYVKAGDLLAEIASPEVNSQLRQTQAQLKTAEVNYRLAKITAKRWVYLYKTHSVSKQEVDEKVSDEKAQAAIVASTRANRDRLLDLSSFEKVIAPFDGFVASRTTDVGRLINAGSGSPVPLFRIVQSDPLRLYVRVPQNEAAQIQPELVAKIQVSQHPGKWYLAKLLDTAKAIDLTTRTLLVQFMVSNPQHELLSGSYGETQLMLPSKKNSVVIPVNTIIFQSKGAQVAVLTNKSTIHLKKIMIGRDYGTHVEVVSGLTPGEKIILNPPDSLVEGEAVKLVL